MADWAERNAKIHGVPGVGVGEVVDWAKSYLLEYKQCSSSLDLGRRNNRMNLVVWPKPPSGIYKMNCDAALNCEGGHIGFGIMIRDSIGLVMAASSQVMPNTFNAQAAEAIAVLKGIQFSIDCGLFPCIFESDAEVIIKWINDRSHMDSVCGSILSDINVLCSELTEVSFSYVPRKGNQLAHMLAKNALLLEENRLWMEEYPCCVAKKVLVDSFV